MSGYPRTRSAMHTPCCVDQKRMLTVRTSTTRNLRALIVTSRWRTQEAPLYDVAHDTLIPKISWSVGRDLLKLVTCDRRQPRTRHPTRSASSRLLKIARQCQSPGTDPATVVALQPSGRAHQVSSHPAIAPDAQISTLSLATDGPHITRCIYFVSPLRKSAAFFCTTLSWSHPLRPHAASRLR